MDTHNEDSHPRFVTIEFFMVEMLGFTSRQSYYDHVNDPGWPRRVFPGGRAMLVYDECLAYQKMLMEGREVPPETPPSRRTAQRRRHTGRPAKATA